MGLAEPAGLAGPMELAEPAGLAGPMELAGLAKPAAPAAGPLPCNMYLSVETA